MHEGIESVRHDCADFSTSRRNVARDILLAIDRRTLSTRAYFHRAMPVELVAFATRDWQ